MEIRINHPDVLLGVLSYLKEHNDVVICSMHTLIRGRFGNKVAIMSPYPKEFLDDVKREFAEKGNPLYISDRHCDILHFNDIYYYITKL